MCKWEADFSHQVNLKIGTRNDFECIDRCIAPIVQALNDAGAKTTASCCGHGNRPGSIALAEDGQREIIIARNYAEARKIDSVFQDIHGEPVGGIETARLNAKIVRLILETRDVVFDDPGHAAKFRALIKETDQGNPCYMDFG